MAKRKSDREREVESLVRFVRYGHAADDYMHYIDIDTMHEQPNRRHYICGGDVPRGVVQEYMRANRAMKPGDWNTVRNLATKLVEEVTDGE